MKDAQLESLLWLKWMVEQAVDDRIELLALRDNYAELIRKYDELLTSSVRDAQAHSGLMLKAAIAGVFTPKD